MAPTVLTQQQKAVLELLKDIVRANDFYLAGGTSLAMQLGHRRSLDFDFFTERGFETERLRSLFPQVELLQEARGTLTVLLQSVRVSFFEYRYPLLQPCLTAFAVPLAHKDDIAAMKLSALAGRGSKKDFVDLYCIIKDGYSLDNIFSLFEKKYIGLKVDRYHIMRSLVYFEDAEGEEMPEMIQPIEWREVRFFFNQEIERRAAQ